jgi:S1-C subfamily serine protease
MMLAVVAVAVLAPSARAQQSSADGVAAFEQSLVNAIEKAGGSVVAIARVDPWDTSRHGERFQPPPVAPGSPEFVPDAYGTGVVVDSSGLILTQYHVVAAKSEHYVTTTAGNIYRAQIHVTDPRSDLAMLKIAPTDLTRTGEYLTAIRFGDASKLKRGQIVVSLGNPYAIARDGRASASWGIISNLSRKIPPNPREGGVKDKLYHFGTLIQTDAKLNLGTSGGALVNRDGEMIGLTTSLAATAGYEQAAGYAIPVDDMFRRAVDAMKQGREVEYGFLGVEPQSLASGQPRPSAGVRVMDVVPGTPAEKAGLKADDVITHVDGQAIDDSDGLILRVGARPVESRVRLTVLRDGRARSMDVMLTKSPVRGQKVVANPEPAWRGLRVDYSTASIDDLRKVINTELLRSGCVLITEVDRDSPAWEAKLQPGMFIGEVGGQRVSSPQEFRAAVLGKSGPIELKVFGDQLATPQPRTIKPTAG